ncbi:MULTISPECIES: UDP-glucose/GDP-mannose dehydrogenase family protein [unclassified Nitratiruptor]|uniref:UDP-glucose dehydrogenase family protein n=1 Tax=unclassified Nitratiruptor TaxID=2624044 RepID=UPI001916BB7D|nr:MULTISPECIES: UDP-glucose/GDP-mannose dehydrogenase family protein [unclassified Nitratiruptor]BCD60532.1 UDPglucose 6-dehydrogenase [Nitratiruptor sp. YY08-10]BCD63979.1 UDPglucose 6-dehydrogenase [Nitratiruptor sp. YY08-14]
MRLSIIGTGYVGLVTGACMAQMGNSVICVDIDEEKIEKLKKGIIPIYEPGLEEIVKENFKIGTLHFTTDIKEALQRSDIVFIAVGTPQGEDGSADLQYVLVVAKDIGKYMTHPLIVVDKSTVPVGTADKVRATIQNELKKRLENGEITEGEYQELMEFDVVSNPEFLKEGDAVNDFMKPDRVVIGADKEKSMQILKELYAPFTRNHERFIAMDIRSAELTKYAANAMLATKISFMNEMAKIAEAVGADINKVRVGIGSDSRIGYSFIYPGVGYGGSCFPKDVKALEKIAIDAGVEPKIIKAVEAVNKEQRVYFLNKILQRFGEDLRGKSFALWGLSFKPETDDMREAPSITIVKELTSRGAKIKAYDPKAMEEAKNFWLKDVSNIEYCDNKYDALNDADAMILVTEWKEFRSPDFIEMQKRLKNPLIFDGRNQYNKEKLKEYGFEYHQVGVQAAI